LRESFGFPKREIACHALVLVPPKP
jgi:hypothetical protein